MSKKIELGEKELRYLQDTDFLISKHRILQQQQALLEQCQKQLQTGKEGYSFPAAVWEVPPKISRGENYKGLPYLVLDYPRIFQQNQVFACRTMFWWGWGFSCTLHLGGSCWQEHKSSILSRLPYFAPQQACWLCVHDTPWEYHYEPSNYRPLENCLQANCLETLAQKAFFKISTRLPLSRYQELPAFCLSSLSSFSQLLY